MSTSLNIFLGSIANTEPTDAATFTASFLDNKKVPYQAVSMQRISSCMNSIHLYNFLSSIHPLRYNHYLRGIVKPMLPDAEARIKESEEFIKFLETEYGKIAGTTGSDEIYGTNNSYSTVVGYWLSSYYTCFNVKELTDFNYEGIAQVWAPSDDVGTWLNDPDGDNYKAFFDTEWFDFIDMLKKRDDVQFVMFSYDY